MSRRMGDDAMVTPHLHIHTHNQPVRPNLHTPRTPPPAGLPHAPGGQPCSRRRGGQGHAAWRRRRQEWLFFVGRKRRGAEPQRWVRCTAGLVFFWNGGARGVGACSVGALRVGVELSWAENVKTRMPRVPARPWRVPVVWGVASVGRQR
eukprot:88208-Chlamydomonas_euryale.AAC.2